MFKQQQMGLSYILYIFPPIDDVSGFCMLVKGFSDERGAMEMLLRS